RALVELDVGDDVRRHLAPRALAAAADGEAVDRATTGRLGPLGVEAVTVRADCAGVPDDVAAGPAAREQQPAFAGGGPELRGLRRRRRSGRRQRAHESSAPRIRVTLPIRVA